LSAEKEQVSAIGSQRKVKHASIFEKELSFFREEESVWSEVEFLRVYIGIGEICINREVCYQIRAQAQLHVYATGVQSTQAWRESRSGSI
jgi:hypothetical protein